ncbi:MAG: metallophosphoesterase [Myxococcaceae bacterium]|nr:metallophosphoesterase [Myxococcaceae bacterium]
MITPRHRVLPSSGWLLVSTDLHGNLEDFRALERVAEDAWRAGVELHWAVLGDLVHGPDAEAAARTPQLHGFPDDSPALIDALTAVMARHPGRVHFVLGNHDAGHLGFKHTGKFHPDEVEALEARLTVGQRDRLQRLCSEALLALVAPCGLLLTHGAPGDAVETLAMLDGPLPPERPDDARFRAVNELLWSYGQPGPVAARLLARVSAETGHELRVVVHGHDRDESGWFIEGENQVQPVLFGAPREQKRYLWVDLSLPVSSCQALEREALRRLYPLRDGGD